jgi:DNA helicase HerA-like ATPase
VEEWLTNETPAGPKLRATPDAPRTFQELLDWFKKNKGEKDFFGDAHAGTKGKLLRRLKYVVQEGDGVLRRHEPKGNPLVIPAAGVDGPVVIDLFALNDTPSLQRFVVAAVLDRIIEYRSGRQVQGLRYLITLDELNRFAPKGGNDPITRQVERVAAEMRSQGVILLGAQQQASLVSPKVVENAAVRAVGRSGTVELEHEVWRFLGRSARSAAAQLQPDEKLLYQPTFGKPMLAKIPFPPFALSEGDAAPAPTPAAPARGSTADLDAF